MSHKGNDFGLLRLGSGEGACLTHFNKNKKNFHKIVNNVEFEKTMKKYKKKVLQDIVISSQKELDEAEVGYYFEVD